MKNFTLALLGLLPLAVCSPAEVIDAVTFNPARLGQYERLKVSDGLTSHGGVEAQSMQVQSNGDVTVNNAGNYQIPQAQINGSLNMPQTRFETPKLNSRGGTAYFDETAGTDIQSHIDELTQTVLRVKANVLNTREVSVKGSPSADYDGNTIQGLKLGGNDIPKPDPSCTGLTWVPRVDKEGNTYQVLGLKTCQQGSHELYGPEIYPPHAFIDDTCPGNDEHNKFTCTDAYKNVKCIDVYDGMPRTSYSWGYNVSGFELADVDTCDGDPNRQFNTSNLIPNPKNQRIQCTDVYGWSNTPSYEGPVEAHWRCDGSDWLVNQSHQGTPYGGNVECLNISGIYCGYLEGKGLSSVQKRVVGGYLGGMVYVGMNQTNINNLVNQACASCIYPSCQKVLVQSNEPECKYNGIGTGQAYYNTVYYMWINCSELRKSGVAWTKELFYRKVDCTGQGDIEGAAPELNLPVITPSQATYL